MQTQELIKIENFSEFNKQIETLTIPELEQLIELFGEKTRWRWYDKETYHKISHCLAQRKYLLNRQFECSPENLERLRNIANLVEKHADILRKKGNELYKQILQQWQDGKNKPFSDFYVELSLSVSFNDEDTSVLHLDDDHLGSDYVKMSEFMGRFHNDFERNLMMYDKRIDYDSENSDRSFDEDEDTKSFNYTPELWESLGKAFPKLTEIPITWAFHHLIDHTNYALQDIIRINDVWGEAKVCWQHITRATGEVY